MGSNNVVSIVHRRAQRLAAEIASPVVCLQPDDDEDIDAFIERIGAAIADLIDTSDTAGLRVDN
jgi:hypothetical protein